MWRELARWTVNPDQVVCVPSVQYHAPFPLLPAITHCCPYQFKS